MQIIFKQNELGQWCLFDTRSEKFFFGGCVKDPERSSENLGIANSVINKPLKTILEMSQNATYGESGYFEYYVAKQYIEMNPDLKIKILEKLKAKVDKKTQRKPRTRKEKAEKADQTFVANAEKRGRGRPRKVVA